MFSTVAYFMLNVILAIAFFTSYASGNHGHSTTSMMSSTSTTTMQSSDMLMPNNSSLAPTSTMSSSQPQMTIDVSDEQTTMTLTWDNSTWWGQWDTFPLTMYEIQECVDLFESGYFSSSTSLSIMISLLNVM